MQAKRLTESYGFGCIRSKPIQISQISARVSEELADQIEAYSDETGEAKSETIRTLLQQGLEYENVANENERLRAQLAAANQRIDASNELVEYVEEERSIARQRAQAGVLTRMKWWLAGMPDESDD